jgi:hypothetical protein
MKIVQKAVVLLALSQTGYIVCQWRFPPLFILLFLVRSKSRVFHCRLVQSIDVAVCDEKKEEDGGVVKWRVVLFVLLWKRLTPICNVDLSVVGETGIRESVPRKWSKGAIGAKEQVEQLCYIGSIGFRVSDVGYSVMNTKTD